MAQVMHGRRAGQVKSAPKPQVPGAPQGMILPNGTDLREVTVVSKADWERIQGQLNKRAIEQERMRRQREEKEQLHKLSQDKVKHWTNTIQGQRLAKLEARNIREAKEEEERKAIDLEEAKYQAAKRKAAIEKAKTQQYYQTDRVKGFHSALLLTEILKEREAQIELKRLKEQASSGQDSVWLDQARRDHEEAILKDQEEACKRIVACRDTAQFQKAQINQHLHHSNKARQEDLVEGEELKKLAIQYDKEKQRLVEIQALEAKQLLVDNIKQREDQKKLAQIRQQQEEEEDEECRIFAVAKRKMMKLRAEKEKEIHIEKQERLEQIREKLSGQMQQKLDDEDERIRRAQEEREAKREAEERGKEEWIKQQYQAMAANRHQQMKEKEEAARQQRKKELEILVVKREADAVFAANEEEKRNRRFEELKELQKTHLEQAVHRHDLDKKSVEMQLAVDKKNQELVEVEEKQFQEYADRVIRHAEAGARNTIPLRKAAREGAGGGLGPVFPGKGGIRPSYMVADNSGVQLPHYQRDTTEETKVLVNGKSQTSKRLGFGW